MSLTGYVDTNMTVKIRMAGAISEDHVVTVQPRNWYDIVSGGTLTFTPANYNVDQDLVIKPKSEGNSAVFYEVTSAYTRKTLPGSFTITAEVLVNGVAWNGAYLGIGGPGFTTGWWHKVGTLVVPIDKNNISHQIISAQSTPPAPLGSGTWLVRFRFISTTTGLRVASLVSEQIAATAGQILSARLPTDTYEIWAQMYHSTASSDGGRGMIWTNSPLTMTLRSVSTSSDATFTKVGKLREDLAVTNVAVSGAPGAVTSGVGPTAQAFIGPYVESGTDTFTSWINYGTRTSGNFPQYRIKLRADGRTWEVENMKNAVGNGGGVTITFAASNATFNTLHSISKNDYNSVLDQVSSTNGFPITRSITSDTDFKTFLSVSCS